MRSEEAPGAMTHATETPERNLAPEPNEQGFRYILNWMKFILEKPCDRTADESFITEWCDFVYQCQSRLAAAEEDVAERDRWLYASKVRENDYHERWLHNLDRATGMASKWGDLENRVFAAEQRADAAESALQSAWGEAGEAFNGTLAAAEMLAAQGATGAHVLELFRALRAPSKAAPEPVNPDYEATARAKPHLYGEPINAAPQEVGTDGITPHDPGPLEVTDVESIVPAGAAPLAEQRGDDVHPFVVKHYGSDAHPSIKGNGFDGLVLGENREEAQDFIDWINARILSTPAVQLRADGVVGIDWSMVRSILMQGAAIQQDYQAGKFATYEHYSARMDAAARERIDELSASPAAAKEWVSVEERLPTEAESVEQMVWVTDGQSAWKAFYIGFVDATWARRNKITHWTMRLNLPLTGDRHE